MKNMKGLIVLMLVLTMCLNTTVFAVEGGETPAARIIGSSESTGETTVEMTGDATLFSVTVPTNLAVGVSSSGEVMTATEAYIENYSFGPVKVAGIDVEPTNGWTLKSWDDTEFDGMDVGKSEYAMSLFGVGADGNGACDVSGIGFIGGMVGEQSSKLKIVYDAKVPVQKIARTETIGKVVFTIGWYTGGIGAVEDEETGYSLRLDKSYVDMYKGASETVHAETTSGSMAAMLLAEDADAVVWSSTNSDVASVDGGKIAAKALGSATVKAEYHGLIATCDVNVSEAPVPLKVIDFTKSSVSLYKGESETVLLTYNPDKFTGEANVDFSVNGDAVEVSPVSLSGVTAVQGATAVTVTGLTAGTNVVTASAEIDGQTIMTTMTVEVIVPVMPDAEYVLTTGQDFNAKIKTLSKGSSVRYSTNDTTITSVVFSDMPAPSSVSVADGTATDVSKTRDGSILAYKNPDVTGEIIVAPKTAGKIVADANSGWMFYYCKSLVALDFSNFDTSNVTNMSRMFSDCSKLSDLIPLANWDVSSVTNMDSMFSYCSNLPALMGLANWNVGAVTDMCSMFYNCPRLTDITGLANWNVGAVTDMSSMFSVFNARSNLTDLTPLTNWNVSAVTNMAGMFGKCSNLTDLTPLTNWNVGAVTNMNGMFSNCSKLSDLVGLEKWNVGAVTNMGCMFQYCSKLTDLTSLANWNVSAITNMNGMFGNCYALTNLIGLANWNVGAVTDMSHMFQYCSKLTDLTSLANWNVSAVTNMTSMFYNCFSLTDSKGFENWNVGAVTNMNSMFSSCSSLTDLTGLKNWNISAVTDTGFMFCVCSNLTDITPIVNWNVGAITDMSRMFYGCSNLTDLDLSNWNTNTHVSLNGFAQACTKLKTIKFGEGFAKGATLPTSGSSNGMFYVESSIPTTVTSMNETVQNYDWAADNRTISSAL